MQTFSHYLLISCLPVLIVAVFTDEAYRTDYHSPLLGIPREPTTFFHRPQSDSRASLLYTLSEQLVLGAVNPKDGTLSWRHHLNSSSSASPGFLRAGEDESTVISAAGSQVTAWDARDGKAVWNNEFGDEEAKDLEVLALEDGLGAKGAKDAIVLFGRGGHTVVRRIDGKTGVVLWEFNDDSEDKPYQISTTASSVHVILLHGSGRAGYKIRVVSLDPLTGKQTEHHTLNSDAEVSDSDSILFVGANLASPIIAWTDKNMKSLKINIIGSKHINSFKISHRNDDTLVSISIHAPHLIKSLPHFLVQYQSKVSHWAEVYHIDLISSTIAKAYDLPNIAGKGTFATANRDANVYFTRITEREVILVSSASHGVLGRWQMSLPLDHNLEGKLLLRVPVHAVSEVIPKAENTFAVRCALVLASGDWLLVRNGETAWLRTEALAGAVAASWANLNAAEAATDSLATEVNNDLFSAYSSRVKRHMQDLRGVLAWLLQLPNKAAEIFNRGQTKPAELKDLQADKFGFQKHVIVATYNGRLYALDTGNQGRIVWSIQAARLASKEKWDVKGIFVESEKSRVTVKSAKGDLVVVDLKAGKILFSLPEGSSPIIESTTVVEAEAGKYLLDIHEDGDPGDIPKVQAPLGQKVLVVRGHKDVVRGLKFMTKGSVIVPTTVWEFVPSPGERISLLTTRPTHDPVASLGRVLGDRSVMYKYLNPNLLLITVVNDAAASASFHLLDSVSGRILHSITQVGVDTSRHITAVMSENWFIYSFWGEFSSSAESSPSAMKGYQLAVAELYDAMLPNDRGPLGSATNFSSLKPSGYDSNSSNPHVISQSFVIPEEISNLAVTQTRQGITSRSILASLPFSNAIISIPKSLIDPRRPIDRDPSPAEAEEGLLRRSAVLEFDPRWIISHKREVIGVEKIITTPALLESTSLVFAFGLDIFGTRVTPSMAFDMLGQEFAKGQLLLTVLGLGAGVMVLAPIVRRSQNNAQWKVS